MTNKEQKTNQVQISCPSCGHLKASVITIAVLNNKLQKVNLICENCWLQFYLDAKKPLPQLTEPKAENGCGSYLG